MSVRQAEPKVANASPATKELVRKFCADFSQQLSERIARTEADKREARKKFESFLVTR